jgi:tetratricopeptide (TPR) repeat protein
MKSNTRTKNQKSSKATPFRVAAVGRSPALWLAPLFVALATWTAFFPSLSNDFVNWDDDTILTNNPHFRGLGWEKLSWMFTTFLMGHYQPLTWVSFALDYSVWGMDPFGYHLTNWLLHGVNAVAFYCVSVRLLSAALPVPSQERPSALRACAVLAALWFAIHPLRVESVAWATERRDVLSGFFYLWALFGYLRGVTTDDQGTRKRWLLAALGFYFLSLLSKATAMTLPAVLLLLDIYPLRRLRIKPAHWLKPANRAVLVEKIPFLLLAAAFAAAALWAQHATGALKPLEQFDLISRALQASFGVMFYLWKTLLPIRLSPIYELPVDAADWFWYFTAASATAVAVTLAALVLARHWPAVAASWFYYLIVLAPVSGIAQSGPQLVADRYSYLACLSWPLLLAGGLLRLSATETLSQYSRVLGSVAVTTVLLLAVLTWNQTEVWRSAKTLWQHAVAVAPPSSIAYYNLGRTFEREEDNKQAVENYRRAIAVDSYHSKAHFNLAGILLRSSDAAAAMEHYRRVIAIRPDHADAHNNLGLLLEAKGDLDAALLEYRAAIKAEPDHDKAHFNRAELLARRGDLAAATASYREAARINPGAAEIQIGLAIVLARQGELASATSHFRRAVELNPDSTDARVLLSRALAAQGEKDEAERQLRKAIEVMKTKGDSSQKAPAG